ncbi:hypothetical protein BSL82_08305 [Tardibacter chloracetimidivorans]|uniref:DUF3489 domain-containing protein n=1 Tax=Tardibacter chloracetimidivorans TaxID=1921510 RepID=A0A1L3ZZH2_9SPHN|nr:DUF3489 domain-containing protein [Tardibacter chloracetimidivorans]API61033.1 hypothetical protein BSL82_08305 [Tardibacter chloracetimidivorans]
MTKLTDLQLVLLATAAQRPDGSLLPPADSLSHPPEVLAKAITALLRRKLAAEVALEEEGADPRTLDARCWRQKGDKLLVVVITDAGRSAIGIGQEPQVDGDCEASGAAADVPPTDEAASLRQNEDPTAVPSEPPSKIAQVLVLLRRRGGASLAEIVSATGWLPHTSRAALTGLRKKGHAIAKEKIEGTTRYQLKAVA